MAKQKKRTPTPVKRRKAIPRARAVAQPPPDNPAWRQQDHLLARLTDSDNGTESPATAAHAELSSGARSLAPIDIVRAPKRVRPQGQLAQARLRLSALSEKSSLFDDDTSSARSPVMLGASNWVQLGPTAIPNGQTYGGARVLVTGRVTAIAVDPTNHQVIYVGAARGGVWKTIDGGRHWTAKSDNEVSLAIGALAIAPSDTQVIYVGTGEGNLERYVQSYALSSSPDNYLGNGVLKSTDGGDTWTNQGAANLTGAAFYGIAVHPTNANIAYAATSSGLFRTTDGGNNWTALSNGLPAITTTIIGATDVAIHPSAPDTVYAAFFADGVYKTTNSGAANPSWTKQTSVLPAGGVGRIALSVSPSSPSTVYALFSDGAESIKGIFRSTTGGGTWTSLGIAAASLANITGSSSYTLNIAVDPTTPDIVYISGTSLFKAVRNTLANAWSLTEIGANIHPDNHAFAFDPASHLSIYAGSDGGIYKSIDGGATWSDSINRGLCITQFEMIDHHPTSDAVLIGGTQDNGTEAYRNSPVFYHADEGDGGFVAIDQAAPTNMPNMCKPRP